MQSQAMHAHLTCSKTAKIQRKCNLMGSCIILKKRSNSMYIIVSAEMICKPAGKEVLALLRTL